jgi:hypothetical protein
VSRWHRELATAATTTTPRTPSTRSEQFYIPYLSGRLDMLKSL